MCVLDTAGRGEVRLAAELDLKNLLRKAPWYHCDTCLQDVQGRARRRHFVDMGQRVHEPTQIVQLTIGICVPTLHEVCALMFKGLFRQQSQICCNVDERRQQPLLCTHGPLSS